MSLSVYLIRKRYISYDKGNSYLEEDEQLYWANITHNLGEMARKAGIYKVLWRPEEVNAERGKDILKTLQAGIADLKSRPEYYEQFNSPNGWGMYEHFVPFVQNYINAIKEYPESLIEVSR